MGNKVVIKVHSGPQDTVVQFCSLEILHVITPSYAEKGSNPGLRGSMCLPSVHVQTTKKYEQTFDTVAPGTWIGPRTTNNKRHCGTWDSDRTQNHKKQEETFTSVAPGTRTQSQLPGAG